MLQSLNLLRRCLSTSASSTSELASMVKMLGGPEASEQLERFSKFGGPAFALIKVGGEVVRDELDVLVTSCTLLHRMGLRPVVVHGGGPQLNAELARDGVQPTYVRGHRVTDEATLRVAERVFRGLNVQVSEALEAMGTPAAAFPSDVFHAEVADHELGFVGEVTGLDSAAVVAALEAGRVPVLTSLGVSGGTAMPSLGGRQLLNINADVAARELAVALQPMRTVFTSAKGGWTDDETGRIVDVVDLTREYEKLAARDYTGRQGTLLKLNEIKLLLDQLPAGSTVSISSAENVTRRLLGSSGGGTLFVRGEEVRRYDSVAQLDMVRLQALLARCGGGGGGGDDQSSAFFERLQRTALGVYATPSLSSCAIVEAPEEGEGAGDGGGWESDTLGIPWLRRLAVAPEIRTTGGVDALWDVLSADFGTRGLRWRGRSLGCGRDLGATRATGTSAVTAAGGGTTDAENTLCWFRSPPPPSADPGGAQTGGKGGDASDTSCEGLADDPRTSEWAALSAPRPPSSLEGAGDRVKVGLLGARGFVGREFARLLAQSARYELVLASSRALVGQSVGRSFGLGMETAACVDPKLTFETLEPGSVAGHAIVPEVDVWVLALPNGLAPGFVEPLAEARRLAGRPPAVLIDLGADFRFDGEWSYGLPERHGAREVLRGATRIANPGCYATGAQVGLMPLYAAGAQSCGVRADPAVAPSVFGVSGYSGAGTSPSPKNDPATLRDNLLPYALAGHVHEREVSHHLGARVGFMPHVAPFFQGISLTLTAQLAQLEEGGFPCAADVEAAYREHYAGEPLIRVLGGGAMPHVRDAMHQHHVSVGGFTVDAESGRLALVATIDNLLKGAATQALQNINIALGLYEFEGINTTTR